MTLVCLQTEVSPPCTTPAFLQGCATSTPSLSYLVLEIHKKVNFFIGIWSYKKVLTFFITL